MEHRTPVKDNKEDNMVNFRTEKVSQHITRIFGICGELWYLVEGSEKAALLDTGSGIGRMKPLIDSLTDKPLLILLTHGHIDHAMGATEFDCPIYMNEADDPIYEEHKSMEMRKGSLAGLSAEIREQIEDSDFIPFRTRPFLPLHHGDCFDLGGITIEAYACVGHTPGSMVFLLREERTLLLGDACNFFTFLFFDYCAPVETYRKNLLVLKDQLSGKVDKILLSHGDGNAPLRIIDGVIDLCQDIMDGRVDNVPFEFMGQSAVIAKATLPTRGRVDGGVGNIVYQTYQIFEK